MRRPDRVTLAVLAVTLLGLLARFVGLGTRPFHWDEARVVYWTLRSLAIGTYEYRPIAGGPFLYVVGRWLFATFGASEAIARAPVALIGGLFPLSALLFRASGLQSAEGRGPRGPAIVAENNATELSVGTNANSAGRKRTSLGLDSVETVSLATVLAFTPPLLYYSRVFRGDLPLAAFGFIAFGFLHRARARGSRRLLYVGAAAFGLALTTSGFALAMIACWLVAALLVFDEGRVRGDPSSIIIGRVQRITRSLSAWTVPVLRATLVTIGVVLFFYIPRGIVDLAHPTTLFSALEAGSLGAANRFLVVRVLGRHAPPSHMNDHALLPFVEGTIEVLLAATLPVVALALWGFIRERYGGRSRPAVSFGAYWAGVGVLVFPAATEVNEPWVAVHPLVPMALPAAVGLAALWRYGRTQFATDDAMRVATALLLLSATGIHAGAVVAGEVYAKPDANDNLPGFAQPEAELRPAMTAASAAIAGNEGTDVLYVGERFLLQDESVLDHPPVPQPARAAFSARLPLAWHIERADGETASVLSPDAVPESPPPVVITTPQHAPTLDEQLQEYERYRVDLALTGRTVVIYVAG